MRVPECGGKQGGTLRADFVAGKVEVARGWVASSSSSQRGASSRPQAVACKVAKGELGALGEQGREAQRAVLVDCVFLEGDLHEARQAVAYCRNVPASNSLQSSLAKA